VIFTVGTAVGAFFTDGENVVVATGGFVGFVEGLIVGLVVGRGSEIFIFITIGSWSEYLHGTVPLNILLSLP
jgi:hypothetical protein